MNRAVNLSICNQKGGIGKSTFTILLASYLHYVVGRDVLVVDCDYPQWSIHAQRERELAIVEYNDACKLLMVRQYKQTGRKLWPIVRAMPTDAEATVSHFMQSGNYQPEIIFYDLPGTVNAEGVIHTLSTLDWLFIPMKADKVVMESTLSFARTLNQSLVQAAAVPLQGIRLFWTMIDRRERTPLYEQYEAAIQKFGLLLLETHIPYRSKFNRELLSDSSGIGRSTLLAPERGFAREAQIEALAEEILSVIKLR